MTIEPLLKPNALEVLRARYLRKNESGRITATNPCGEVPLLPPEAWFYEQRWQGA